MTLEINVVGIAVSVDGTPAQCGFDTTKTPIKGKYTTGNTILTGETEAGVMGNVWYE